MVRMKAWLVYLYAMGCEENGCISKTKRVSTVMRGLENP